jgi:RHS repeat-associated protein
LKTDASGSWTYAWDYENRLKQASVSGGDVFSYFYDALGRRVRRTSSVTGTVDFVYDGVDVITDRDSAGATLASYLNAPGIDNKLRQTSAVGSLYFLGDHLQSTRMLTDASGAVTTTLDYDSFGNVVNGSAFTRYTYTGREIDSETAQMYYRARWYNPVNGTFLSEDPKRFRGGLNLYAYTKNSPVNFTDPNGTVPVVAIIGAVIVVEFGIHYYLSNRAWKIFPNNDQHGRAKHCYVNCMSTRIHGNPVWPTIFDVAQEVPDLIGGLFRGSLGQEIRESGGDMAVDHLGQALAPVITKSCEELCRPCRNF